MPQLYANSTPRGRCTQPTCSSLPILRLMFMAALLCGIQARDAEAQTPQTWSSSRGKPKLRQLVSVDPTGEMDWVYEREDIAGDGLASFDLDEAGTDLRTVYADADSKRLWLRTYVASGVQPPPTTEMFFFADADGTDKTGGPAFGATISTRWNGDPTYGGYERAIGVRGDGTLLGAWSWDSNMRVWSPLRANKDDVVVELGVGEDPIRLGARTHGYVQISVTHVLSGLNVSCAGNLFVRTWHDAAAPRSFGDDDAEAYQCRPPKDRYGDPYAIRSVRCRADKDCPNDGRCQKEVCLFAYPCESPSDCETGEACTNGACVRSVPGPCSDSSDCMGLVCENSMCVACSSDETGGRACASGLVCSPNGTCVDVTGFVPGSVGDGGVYVGEVRGGAFHCAVGRAIDGRPAPWLLCLACASWLLHRRSRRNGRVS